VYQFGRVCVYLRWVFKVSVFFSVGFTVGLAIVHLRRYRRIYRRSYHYFTAHITVGFSLRTFPSDLSSDVFASDNTSDGTWGDQVVDFLNDFRRINPTEICVGQHESDENIFASSKLPSKRYPTKKPTKSTQSSNFR
ncbi:hypothetical protein PIB30_101572, partial [Stylosanthes scabra]|nr:hypothetical protein [Stylosanthes scabra]